MSAARHLLIFGGMALALLGMTYGLWYAVFDEHQELEGIGKSLAMGFSAAAQRNSGAAEGALEQYRELKYDYDRHVDVHGHWIGLAMVLIVLGIGLERLELSEQFKTLAAASLLLGSLVFPLGVLLQTWNHGSMPRGLAIAGSVLVIAPLAILVLGFARAPKSS